MNFKLMSVNKDQNDNYSSAKEAEQYIQKLFSELKPLKKAKDELKFAAQQEQAKLLRKRGETVDDPKQLLIKNHMAPGLGEARKVYQGCLEQLLESSLTVTHQEALAAHQQTLLQRMEKLKQQKADTNHRLAELQKQQVTAANQAEQLAEALANGDEKIVQAIETQEAPSKTEIDGEREKLQGRLPILEQAMLMLSSDIRICEDMGEKIKRNLLLQEYHQQLPIFTDILAELKPVYIKCMNLSRQLDIKCKEKDSLIELAEQL